MKYCERCGAAFRSSRTCPRDGIPLRAGTADPMIGRVLGDRYRVLERIGAGGMGQVYRAAHTRIACGFAVKIVWGDIAYEKDVQARFAREAEVGSCLSSRFITRVVDFGFAENASTPLQEGADQGLPYIVMELVDGPTLYDELLRVGAMEPSRVVRIAHRVALGLAHAHERGVVHRDLKPENILLVREDDEDDVPKLLDFGVAKQRDGERLTSGGVTVGTPLYMAPEQIRGGEVDARTDLYAFGVVLHEMLTGKPPFDANTLEELLRKHITEAPPSMRASLEPKGHGALDDLVLRLLQKRPQDRFGSARELAAALVEIAAAPESRPVVAAPVVTRSEGAVDPTIQAQIERAIVSGAPLYNKGDHAGCAELYANVARALADAPTTSTAVAARLAAALFRARQRRSATDAAWDLRFAFDDLLAPALFDAGKVSGYARELAAFGAISARREAQGQVEILGDYYLAFARIVAARARGLGTESGGPASGDVGWVRALDEAVREAERLGAGAAAKNVIEPALRAIGPTRSPARTVIPQLSTSVRTEIAKVGVPAEATDRILRAIRAGAPAFNEGRPDVCARVYREAACEVVAFCSKDASSASISAHVTRAIEEADRRTTPSDAAWVLRYAFDAVLATAAVPASP